MKTSTLIRHKSFTPAIILLLVSLAACNKGTAVTPNSSNSTKGYIIVSCGNCMVQYGMPDQYKTFNTAGTSPKATFTYTAGYKLVTYITALGATQNLTLSIYNKNDVTVYTGTVKQSTTGYWSTTVPMTDSTTSVE